MALTLTLWISLAGAVVTAVLGRERPSVARVLALVSAMLGAGAAIFGAWQLGTPTGLVTLVRVPWIPALGIEFHLAADGVSLVLLVLTGIAAVAGILFSWNVEDRANEFFALYLMLIAGVYGVFMSFDLFQFFAFYELAIVPKYFLIAIWGSTRREYGAMKLALYSFIGSAMVLVGMIAMYVVAGLGSFDMVRLSSASLPNGFQVWAFPLMTVGFAILAGLWPFHTWAPTGHVAAPTAASMLLAGVVMKLGAYGVLRVGLMLMPDGAKLWGPALAALAVIGIVYAALVALVQQDFKFVIGYSSVSHMGFVLLGLAAANPRGVAGAILQMFSHGVIAGLLFGVVGRMVYDRTHTRELTILEGLSLARALPFAAVIFTLASMASMGLPGFSGFVAELQVLLGAWQSFPVAALAGGVGVVISVAFTLRVLQRAFLVAPGMVADGGGLTALDEHAGPITWAEKVGALLLLGTSLAVGVYPRLLMDWIDAGLQTPGFEALRTTMGWP
ncbi:MAG: NADH-quinone oxidoreductase subunit M [Verrucomicrobiales bacterium]|nr:NADH-quinone oxidoreductase subunit M [Verrucomicrobiales bacterium]